MATKKQKRQMMEQRRAEFEADLRSSGLKAQEADRVRREEAFKKAMETAHEKHFKFVTDCSLCQAIKAKQALAKIIPSLNKVKVTNG